MDPRHLWLNALRSGQYKQCTRTLRRGDAFDALGVLCDLATKHRQATWVWQRNDWYCDGDNKYLPRTVSQWAALHPGEIPEGDDPKSYFEPDPYIPSREERLSVLSDKGIPFAELADLIENEVRFDV